MKQFRMRWIVGVIVILALGIGITIRYRARNNSTGFESVVVKRESVNEAVFGVGLLESDEAVVLRSGVVSSVARWFVTEGQIVRTGAPLVSLEGVGELRSPITGTVTHRYFQLGEPVFPQAPIVSVVNLEKRTLRVALEQRAMMRVRKGLMARIQFDSIREKTFRGTVESLVAHEGQFLVRIRPQELDANLLPGMTGEVAIEIREIPNALVIPLSAISEAGVRVGANWSSSVFTNVEIGQRQGAWVEVLSGLKEGDRIWVPTKETKR